MGAVYVARQRSINVLRALKLMHAPLVHNTEMRERFVREARIGASVGSDHVVQVINAGVDRTTGLPWIAMELLEGKTLAEHMEARTHLPSLEITTIWLQLCSAVAAAHARDIVHRDLKPENIFLARSRIVGMPFVVKVLDFGIAKMVAENWQNTLQAGSPMYMAPEQTSQTASISQRTDVWSLGLIAFLLFTGRHFWRAAYIANPTIQQIIREAMVDAIPEASARAADYGCQERLPPGFDGWFARCVARQSEARFPDGATAGDELLKLLGTESRISEAPALPRTEVAMGDRSSNPDRHSNPVSSDRERTDRERTAPSSGDPSRDPMRASVPSRPDLQHTSDYLQRGAQSPAIHHTPHALPPVYPAPLQATAQYHSHTGAPATSTIVPQKARMVLPLVGGAAALVLAVVLFVAFRGPSEESNSAADSSGTTPLPLPSAPAATAAPSGMVAFAGGTLPLLPDSDQRGQARNTSVKPFSFDANEVTVAEYKTCVSSGRCEETSGLVAWKDAAAKDVAEWNQLCNATQADRGAHPINCVSWDQAEAYCKSVGKRLPTDEEWEFAARGAAARAYPWGSGDPTTQRANLCDKDCADFAHRLHVEWAPSVEGSDGFAGTAPAGSFKAGDSPEGIHDLLGNVSEWTATRQCDGGDDAQCNEFVVRGGGCQTTKGEQLRKHRPRGVVSVNVGFRCAMSPSP